jgi:methionyl-tRNA synthetase
MKQANEYMSQEEPWKLAGIDQERFEKVIKVILADLEIIAFSLKPFLPETAEKIQMALREGKTEPLFQRI